MENNTFFGKVLINALKGWTGCFGDDLLMRNIVQNCDTLHGKWRERVLALKKEIEDEQESPHAYVGYDKILSRDDVHTIVDEILHEHPEMAEPFELKPNAHTLGGLLDLTDFETFLLDVGGRFHQGIDWDIFQTLNRLDSLTRYTDAAQKYAEIFEVDYAVAQKALNGFLNKSGIFSDKRAPKGFYSINDDLWQAYSVTNLTPETIEEVLFPQMFTSSLTTQDYPHLKTEIERTARTINASLNDNSRGTNIMLCGQPGTGKTELALALAKEHGWNIRAIGDISVNDTAEKNSKARLANLKLATKILARDPKAVLLFDEMEDLVGKSEEQQSFSKAYINRVIETTTVPIIWTTNALAVLGVPILRRMKFSIGFDVPPESARLYMWEKYAKEFGLELDEATLKAFAKEFDITPALIRNAAQVAGSTLADSKDDREAITQIVTAMDTLVNFGRKRTFKLPDPNSAEPVEKPYDASCSNTDRDLDAFTEKLLKAKPRFSLLLYGVPGSGKSQYGKELAKRMGKEVLYKRASDILGMYVGENEKNIADAFKEASEEGKVLLIDEGDTFIRDRQLAVRSWEASMTNEMLTQMETMDQPFILTTNLKDDLDPASLRRFTFKLKFDFMKPEQAVNLFKSYFGYDAPAGISRETMLTPGDFANVQNQVDILGIDDPEEICRLLIEEVRQKPNSKSAIGF